MSLEALIGFMAREHEMAANGEAQQDMPAHVATYTGFLSLFKWGAIASFVVGFIVILLIAG